MDVCILLYHPCCLFTFHLFSNIAWQRPKRTEQISKSVQLFGLGVCVATAATPAFPLEIFRIL